MKLNEFYKYCATGNDFVIFDNRDHQLDIGNENLWSKICQRKTGVGADGVILIENYKGCDFKMAYANCDGKEASMCGNGARAASHFCHHLLKMGSNLTFKTQNGQYESIVNADNIKLKMSEFYDEQKFVLDSKYNFKNSFYMNTGVEHFVIEVESVEGVDINKTGALLRNLPELKDHGANINFVEVVGEKKLFIRTYEKGVEAETLSCGTGVVASAVAAQRWFGWDGEISFETKGGGLRVEIDKNLDNVYLCGKVDFIFKGSFNKHFC